MDASTVAMTRREGRLGMGVVLGVVAAWVLSGCSLYPSGSDARELAAQDLIARYIEAVESEDLQGVLDLINPDAMDSLRPRAQAKIDKFRDREIVRFNVEVVQENAGIRAVTIIGTFADGEDFVDAIGLSPNGDRAFWLALPPADGDLEPPGGTPPLGADQINR